MQDPARVMRRRVCRTGENRRDRAGQWSGRVARERGAKRVEVGGDVVVVGDVGVRWWVTALAGSSWR